MARSAGSRTSPGPAAGKQQFNVYLPPPLIRRAKHAAIDHAISLSRMVEVALTDHLDRLEALDQPAMLEEDQPAMLEDGQPV
jgi:hypothetical protein